MITVALVDDDRFLREALGAWLCSQPGLDLVCSASDVRSFLDAGATPDVVLLDLNLRDHSTVSRNVERILAKGTRVIVVSTVPDPEFVIEAIEAGASGYLTKDRDLEALASAIEVVAAGGDAIPPELAFAFSTDRRPTRPKLSDKELQVASLYGSGLPMKSVARHMGIAEGTAHEYLSRVKRKYAEVGREARTKHDLAARLREDRLELRDMGTNGTPSHEPGTVPPKPQSHA